MRFFSLLSAVTWLSLLMTAATRGQEVDYDSLDDSWHGDDGNEVNRRAVPSAPLVVEQLAFKSRSFGSAAGRQEQLRAAASARDCPAECDKEECVSPSECEAGLYFITCS